MSALYNHHCQYMFIIQENQTQVEKNSCVVLAIIYKVGIIEYPRQPIIYVKMVLIDTIFRQY